MSDKTNLYIVLKSQNKLERRILGNADDILLSDTNGTCNDAEIDKSEGQLITAYDHEGLEVRGRIALHSGISSTVSATYYLESAGAPTPLAVSQGRGNYTNIYGITFDGTNIIASIYDEYPHPEFGQFYFVEMSGKTATVIRRFAIPTTDARGMSWDGTNIIYADMYNEKVYILNGKTSSIKKSIDIYKLPSETTRPCGVVFDGRTIFITDKDSSYTARYNYDTGEVIKIGLLIGSYPHGGCVDKFLTEPSVVTLDYIFPYSAYPTLVRFRGEVTNDGGETEAFKRYIEYKEGLEGNVTSAECSSGLEGIFYKNVYLEYGKQYYFRAKLKIPEGWLYGEWLPSALPVVETVKAERRSAYLKVRLYGEIL